METIVKAPLLQKVVGAMLHAHPYEEVAYDIYPLENRFEQGGSGMVGELADSMTEKEFMDLIKERFGAPVVRHSRLTGNPVRRVALCGGAGSFLLPKAKAAGADVFVTGDFKYHQFFDADGKIVVMDIGHYESERFTRELFYELLMKKFPKFAVRLSETDTNPIKYY